MGDSDSSVICLDSPRREDDTTVYGIISFMKNEKEIKDCIEINDSDDEQPRKRTKKSKITAKKRLKTKKEDNSITDDDLLQPMFAISKPVRLESGVSEPNFDKSEYPCSFCAKIFYNKNMFNMHELEHFKEKIIKRRKEKEKNRHVCMICDQCFNEKSAYQWHVAECSGKLLAEVESKNPKITRNSSRTTR